MEKNIEALAKRLAIETPYPLEFWLEQLPAIKELITLGVNADEETLIRQTCQLGIRPTELLAMCRRWKQEMLRYNL